MRTLAAVIAIILLTETADAQRRGRERDARPSDRFAERGDVALAFSAHWLAVGPYQGGIGGRYWIADRTVVSAAVSLRLSSSSEEQELSTEAGEAEEESEREFLSSGLTLGVEQHLGRSRRVSPFLAGYVRAGRGTQDSRQEREDPFSVQEFEETQTSIGGALAVGGEYRFAPGLTLGASHEFGVRYTRHSVDQRTARELADGRIDELEQTRRGSDVFIGTQTSMLVLSVYF